MADPSIIIDAEPDWKDTPEVSYAFSTVVQANQHFKEQRRPMHTSVIRGLRCTFTLETENAQRVLNRLISGAPQVCCVPIYSEPLFADAITQGATLLTLQTDLSYLWNAQNSSYFILLDYTTGASEMLKVASVSGQAVTLSVPIAGVWVAARTVIYPAMASVVKDVKANNITSRVAAFDAQFDEINIGEEATKAWIGVPGQTCIGVVINRVYISNWNYTTKVIALYYNPVSHLPVGASIDTDNISEWTLPIGNELLCSHPWTGIFSGRNDYILCDRQLGYHKFWVLDGFTENVRTTFVVPGVTQSGYESGSSVKGFGCHPNTGKFYVCCGSYVGGTYIWYRRNLRYSSPGGTLEYDSGNVRVDGGGAFAAVNLLFCGNKIYEHYESSGYGYSTTYGLKEINTNFANVSGGINSKYYKFYKADGSAYDVWVDQTILSFDGVLMWMYNALSFYPLSYVLISIDPTKFYTVSDAYNTIGVPFGSWTIVASGINQANFPRQLGNVGYSRF